MRISHNSIWSESAIQLGKIQVEFESKFSNSARESANLNKLTVADKTSELLKICSREKLSYKCFLYLEDYLIKSKQLTRGDQHGI